MVLAQFFPKDCSETLQVPTFSSINFCSQNSSHSRKNRQRSVAQFRNVVSKKIWGGVGGRGPVASTLAPWPECPSLILSIPQIIPKEEVPSLGFVMIVMSNFEPSYILINFRFFKNHN